MADRREAEKSQPSQPSEKKKETGYIREQIVQPKPKPVRTVKFVCVGLLFVLCAGTAAGASFAFVNHWLTETSEPEESGTVPSHSISYNAGNSSPQDTEDKTESCEEPVESDCSHETESEPEASSVTPEQWLEAYLETREFDLHEIESMNSALYQIYQKIQNSIVTIQAVQADSEGFSSGEQQEETFGIIASVTQTEAILLADGHLFQENSVLMASVGNIQKEAQIRQRDDITGITALAISLEGIPENVIQKLTPVTLGNSYSLRTGEMVLLAGSPMGVSGSVRYGYISYIQKNVSTFDGEYRVLYTDNMAVENAGGAMFNTKGELVGWLDTSSSVSQRAKKMQCAIAISDVKYIVEDVIAGINTAYMGVKVSSVTEHIASAYVLPEGVYVTEVSPMSPAYQAGIQPGDVITNIQSASITDVQSFQKIISVLKEESEISVVLQRRGRDGYKERIITLELGSR